MPIACECVWRADSGRNLGGLPLIFAFEHALFRKFYLLARAEADFRPIVALIGGAS